MNYFIILLVTLFGSVGAVAAPGISTILCSKPDEHKVHLLDVELNLVTSTLNYTYKVENADQLGEVLSEVEGSSVPIYMSKRAPTSFLDFQSFLFGREIKISASTDAYPHWRKGARCKFLDKLGNCKEWDYSNPIVQLELQDSGYGYKLNHFSDQVGHLGFVKELQGATCTFQ